MAGRGGAADEGDPTFEDDAFTVKVWVGRSRQKMICLTLRPRWTLRLREDEEHVMLTKLGRVDEEDRAGLNTQTNRSMFYED